MFRWYGEAEICVAYLADVPLGEPMEKSVWFRRGWILQELLAPDVVVFASGNWEVLGHKCGRNCPPKTQCADRGINDYSRLDVNFHIKTEELGSIDEWKSGGNQFPGPVLNARLSNATGIYISVLECVEYSSSMRFERIESWMQGRETTKSENMIYSLLGVFGVHLRLVYGEGVEPARRRMLDEIWKSQQYDEFQALVSQIEVDTKDWRPYRSSRPLVPAVSDGESKARCTTSVPTVGTTQIGIAPDIVECSFRQRFAQALRPSAEWDETCAAAGLTERL